MTNSVDLQITLTTAEADGVRAAFADAAYEPGGHASYLIAMRRLAHLHLPNRLIEALERIKSSSENAIGSLQVDNIPIDQGVFGSPITGETGNRYKEGVLSENLLVAIGTIVGEPYSISHEGHELVNNLTPHKKHSLEFTGLGSDVELDFHIENAAQAHMPGGDTSPLALILLGIRNEPDGGPLTRVADARRAIASLTDEDRECLYSPNYIIRVPYRWRGATRGGQENTGLVPILAGPLDAPRVTVAFYPDMVIPVNDRAKQALEALYVEIRKVSFGVNVAPGRLLAINNNFALHSRDRFTAQYDENDRAYRWVQRVFVARNLWDFRQLTKVHDRVFDPKLRVPLVQAVSSQAALAERAHT